MFNRLRLRLTALYILVAVIFMAVLTAVTYGLLAYYFQTITDLALRHKMAHEFRLLGLSLPSDLDFADQEWYQIRRQIWPQLPLTPQKLSLEQIQENWQRQLQHLNYHLNDESLEETYDSELAAVFLIPLDAAGQMINPDDTLLNLAHGQLPEQTAVLAAMEQGQDLRTVTLSDGARVRLLTYRLTLPDGGAFFQLGRLLTDQDYILQRFLNGLFVVGAVGLLLSALGSWWLAGRSLLPVQESFERQRTFVANASHELRTPLTLIRASAEVAYHDLQGDPENRMLLADVIQEVDQMTRLVDDLLFLSRLDAKRVILKRSRIELFDLLGEAQREGEQLANGRNILIRIEEASGTLLADRTRLSQVLRNLLDNSLHHTPDGGVITLAAGRSGNIVRITVTDSGEGIPTENLPYVFDRFYQVDSARNIDGSGLGLSIAKSLVEAHQGWIKIESQLGHGACVTVELPSGDADN
jgi:signal transduction histidine kinase